MRKKRISTHRLPRAENCGDTVANFNERMDDLICVNFSDGYRLPRQVYWQLYDMTQGIRSRVRDSILCSLDDCLGVCRDLTKSRTAQRRIATSEVPQAKDCGGTVANFRAWMNDLTGLDFPSNSSLAQPVAWQVYWQFLIMTQRVNRRAVYRTCREKGAEIDSKD